MVMQLHKEHGSRNPILKKYGEKMVGNYCRNAQPPDARALEPVVIKYRKHG